MTPYMFAEYLDYEPMKLVLSQAQADDFLAAGLIKEGDYIIMKLLPGGSCIGRAVRNSPPPLDDVGGNTNWMLDPLDPNRTEE